MRIIALIVAAGNSERLGGNTPKPYISIGGKTVLRRTVETFLSHPKVDGVRVVINRAHHPLYKQSVTGLTLFPPVVGGKSRQESVQRGLESIARAEPMYVLIHDAARPLVSHALITSVIEELAHNSAVLPALPVADTLKKTINGALESTIDREGLINAQTPQGFHFTEIYESHAKFATLSVTDDIALAETAGLTIGLVPGERANFKLTTPDDVNFMTQIVSTQDRETRTGSGFDVHPFVAHDDDKPEGRRDVTVCGIKIPYPYRLKGNSDADVGLHSLVDAILGAIGEGDLGMHFAPDDPRWSGADSSRFLIYAYQLLKQKGGEIVNLDITIIGESPKIGPHREAMRERIADLLKISISRVNIKGCTTERLGFLGRSEGLAAQAIATITLPCED